MKFRSPSFTAVLVSVSIAGCMTASIAKAEEAKADASTSSAAAAQALRDDRPYASPSQIDPAAKRYLRNVEAGDLMMKVFQRALEQETDKNPGMSELARRAFANVTMEDFEDIAARTYTRHLSSADLEKLADFTGSSPGGRLFKSIFAKIAESQPVDPNEIMRQFNADELTAILKFFQSDTFAAIQKKLPVINAEMAAAGKKFGEDVMKAYINGSK